MLLSVIPSQEDDAPVTADSAVSADNGFSFGAMEALRALGSFAAELALAQAAQAEAEEAQGEVPDEWPGRVALRWY